jgi:hypothetical protein
MIKTAEEMYAFTAEYIKNNPNDKCNPAKSDWNHRIVSRKWKDGRKEADACLVWVMQTYGISGIKPSDGKLWAGQFLPMKDEISSRVIFYTNDATIAKAFSEKWT